MPPPKARYLLNSLSALLLIAGVVSGASLSQAATQAASLDAAPTFTASSTAGRPALMLDKVYRPTTDLQAYWVSEKYDGVRGYWDGQKLLTRGGQAINAPAWFTARWPTTPMDGELWAGRGQFAKAVSTVRQQRPVDTAWQGMRFMVFDLPAAAGPFTERLAGLPGVVDQIGTPWVQAVAQSRLASQAALQALLKQTVKAGGEGLALHRASALYQGVRNDDLLKLKLHDDAEARVVGHIPGKGKYNGQLGALLVEMPAENGQTARRFKLGTGLSDIQRQNPPAIGTLVTYRYRGVTGSGLPRFASFMRLREGELM